jgi:hypothetical protein
MTRHFSWHILALLLVSAACLLGEEPSQILRNGHFFQNDGASLEGWSLRGGVEHRLLTDDGKQTATLRLSIGGPGATPWSQELHQLLTSGLRQGEVLLLSFEYKMSEGYCFHFYWQQDTSPWSKLLSLRFSEPSDIWTKVKVAVPVHGDYAPNRTAVSFHLAECSGVLELRNLSVQLYPVGTPLESLKTNVNPVYGGDFYDKDWRQATQKLAQEQRQGQWKVTVRRGGRPVPSAMVRFRQTGRGMKIGAEVSLAALAEDIPGGLPSDEPVKRLSRQDRKNLPQYRQLLLEPANFDFLTVSRGLLWKDYDKWGAKCLVNALESAVKAGKELRGHALYCPAFMFAPPYCRRQSKEALWQSLQEFIGKAMTQNERHVAQWIVVHNPVEYAEMYNFLGVESLRDAFVTARQASPMAQLLLSEATVLTEFSEKPLDEFLELLDWLRNGNAPIDGIVLGANFKRIDVAPQSLEKRLDRVIAKLNGLSLGISNFAVNEENQQLRADILRDYLLLFFSRPQITSVSFGELWAPALLNPNFAFYDQKLQPLPVAEAVWHCLNEDWLTPVTELKTDERGVVTLPAFYGDYEITVKSRLGRSQTHHRFSPDNRELLLDLNNAD